MFRPYCTTIFRLIFEQVECTIDNAFNLRDLVLQEFCSCNYNLIKYKVVYDYIIYILYYI